MATTPDLEAVEDALLAAVAAASGLAAGQVVLANENARAPAGSYITIRTDGPYTVGGPKAETQTYDAARPAGQEVELTRSGPGELVVGLQSFSDATGGSSDAQALLARVQAALQDQAAYDVLNDAGVSILDFGRVLSVPKVYGSAMEGRAALDLRAYVSQSASSRTGYIATVSSPFWGIRAAIAGSLAPPTCAITADNGGAVPPGGPGGGGP